MKADKDLKQRYAAEGRSYEAQREFKRKWCDDEFKKIMRAASYKESSTEREQMHGENMNLSSLCWEFKSRAAGVNYMSECIRRHRAGQTHGGKPWVVYNGFIRSWTFRFVRQTDSTTCDKKWMLEERGEPTSVASSSDQASQPIEEVFFWGLGLSVYDLELESRTF